MNKLITTLVAASLLLAPQTQAFATDYGRNVKPVGPVSLKYRSDRSSQVAAGIVFGAIVLGAALASRAYAAPQHRGNQCRTWQLDCRYGSERACYKYDTHC